jgi:membrane-associated phospholipid phosphatase
MADTDTDAAPAGAGGTERPPWRRGALAVGATLALIVLLMLTVDPQVARWALRVGDLPGANLYRRWVTPLGKDQIHGMFIIALLLAALIARSWSYARVALAVGLTWAIGGGVCHLIKIIAHRPRPEYIPAPWNGHWGASAYLLENAIKSFPSGDVTIAAGLATTVFLAIGRGRARYVLFLWPVLVGISRVLGAKHYPSDAVGGMLLGTLTAMLVWRWVMGSGSRPSPSDQATSDSVSAPS